jgi:hypothetical protein
MYSKIEKYKPAVNKKILLILSGIMWMGVGIMLNTLAYKWLHDFTGNYKFADAGLGFAGAMIIHHFGFSKIADKNLGRISGLKGKPCIFSFMSWKSYLIVLVMVSMGVCLRHSTIPKQYLSIIYIGIGLALFLSSLRYFKVLGSQMTEQEK